MPSSSYFSSIRCDCCRVLANCVLQDRSVSSERRYRIKHEQRPKSITTLYARDKGCTGISFWRTIPTTGRLPATSSPTRALDGQASRLYEMRVGQLRRATLSKPNSCLPPSSRRCPTSDRWQDSETCEVFGRIRQPPDRSRFGIETLMLSLQLSIHESPSCIGQLAFHLSQDPRAQLK
jgi:hypothetical protein